MFHQYYLGSYIKYSRHKKTHVVVICQYIHWFIQNIKYFFSLFKKKKIILSNP